jgi:hypothetical protein
VNAGQAWIQKGGQGEWFPVAADIAVALGDHVKTGAESGASIDFFDGATARLDAETEVVVRDLAVDEENAARQRVSIEVLAGRIWSRILKFLDKESSYSAQMSDVVATVRGTAFVMDATEPAGWVVRVVDSGVAVGFRSEAGDQLVAAGEEAWIPKAVATGTPLSARRMQRRKMDSKLLRDRWFTDNERRDEEFLARVRDRRLRELKTAAGILPGSPFYGMKRIGERLRLALVSDGDRRRELSLGYADRRFGEILTLATEGRRDAAMRLLPDFHRRYRQLLAEIEEKRLDEERRDTLCRRLRGRFLEQDLRLRDVDGESDLPAMFARMDRPPPDLKVLPRELRDRLCAAPLPAIREIPVLRQGATSTKPAEASPSGAVNANVPTEPLTNAPLAQPTLTKLGIVAQRTILSLPDTQQLRAIAAWSDGSTKDVTDSAVWETSAPDVLSAVGGFVITLASGSATVTAEYGGQASAFAIRVLVPESVAVTLQSLTVNCSPSTIPLQGSAVCSATARYSDGSAKDVTALAAFFTDPKFGSMGGNSFFSNGAPGTATVSASYADGTTVTGATTLTIR